MTAESGHEDAGRVSDRFHVGQSVGLVMGPSTGWPEAHGLRGTILAARKYGEWPCASYQGTGHRTEKGYRYGVRVAALGKVLYLLEEHMRPFYDGEEASTWEEFAKVTGLRIRLGTGRLKAAYRKAKGKRARRGDGK